MKEVNKSIWQRCYLSGVVNGSRHCFDRETLFQALFFFFFEWRQIMVKENFSSLFHFIICNVASWNYFCMFPSLLLSICESFACWAANSRRRGSYPSHPVWKVKVTCKLFSSVKSSSLSSWTICLIIRASCHHVYYLLAFFFSKTLRAMGCEALT